MNVGAAAKTLLTPSLVTAILLIFGGCCSNVYTLESITHQVAGSGTAITFAQFLGVSIGSFLQASVTAQGRQAIWKHKVPLLEYGKIVGFHFSVSILNNMALDYHISVPVHIILRSGGSMVTMLLAYVFYGKRYTSRQIAAVLLVTLGVIVSTVSGGNSKSHETVASEGYSRFALGVSFMVLSQFLASAMGLYVERTFRVFSPIWRETLFFTHLLALPFFLPFLPTIWHQLRSLGDSEPTFSMDQMTFFREILPCNPPILISHLILNVVTQLICVTGVNQLASTSTALSVSIVLNLRKFTSLVLSFVIFGHHLDSGIVFGAIFVFLGALWYSQEKSPGQALEVKHSGVDLYAMSEASGSSSNIIIRDCPKSNGTPMLEKGVFEHTSETTHRRTLSISR